MNDTRPALVWFRQDLRLADNPALHAAVSSGAPVCPVFVHDDDAAGDWKPGPASRWWLSKSLASLSQATDDTLRIYCGRADQILPRLARDLDACGVFWNRCYEPWRVAGDSKLKERLREAGVAVRSFNGSYLYDPAEVSKKDGTPYRVFTPFYKRGCLEQAPEPRVPLPAPEGVSWLSIANEGRLEEEPLLPASPWSDDSTDDWRPGEGGAWEALGHFLEYGLECYAEGRDRPDRQCVSRLSPHLHFGEISPHQVRKAVLDHAGDNFGKSVETFLSELGWREFSAHLLCHEPEMPTRNLQKKFDRFPWQRDEDLRKAWQSGMTGYPIVDAGMRELRRTGYMHNRVRMIAASFLVKNLLQDWRYGERWFWDCLVDADLANNSASWQWVAGSGADAAPYFRIFNPVTQGRKFDPDGVYVRRYVPELADLPDKFVHCPWDAPEDILAEANVRLGDSYPRPVVDLAESRNRALEAFRSI